MEVSKKMRVLLLGHNQEMLDKVPDRSWMKKIRLDLLPIGKYQRNEFAESRIFLHDVMKEFEGRRYVGIASASWNKKYKYLGVCKIQNLGFHHSLFAPNRVFIAHPNISDWKRVLSMYNRGIDRMLYELAEYTNTSYCGDVSCQFGRPSKTFFANNFLCHHKVFEDFLSHFRKVFEYFDNKYGVRFPFIGLDRKRTPAHFYEAVTMNYFANRSDLMYVQPTAKGFPPQPVF